MDKEHSHFSKKRVCSLLEWVKVPPGKQIIPSIWTFKDKIYPDGIHHKFKARINDRGDLQRTVVTDDTYITMVLWTTVLLLFFVFDIGFIVNAD